MRGDTISFEIERLDTIFSFAENEIAKKYNISSERIRQIESRSLRKLRHPSRVIKIKEFYEEEK